MLFWPKSGSCCCDEPETHAFPCICTSLPLSVFLTDVGTLDPSGYLRDATLTYGSFGPSYAPYDSSSSYGPTWISEEFTHPTDGYKYKLALYCNTTTGHLPAIMYIHNFSLPGPHLTGIVYYWYTSDPANECDPLSWTHGQRLLVDDSVEYTLT